MTAIVEDWRKQLQAKATPRRVALPHPSWRNNAWLAANPWFEAEMLPKLRRELRRLLS
jgi:uracil-DNA glycosylase